MKKLTFFLAAAALLLAAACKQAPSDADLTRGIGVYPGAQTEFFGPGRAADDSYRNLAKLRAAYHSSSFDYNLTAQLVTDGLVSTDAPYFLDIYTQNGPIAKRDCERLFDDNNTSVTVQPGKDAFLEIDVHNGTFQADQIELVGSTVGKEGAKGYEVVFEATADGKTWETLKSFKGNDYPGEQRRMGAFGRPGGGSQNVAVTAGLSNNAQQPQMTPEQQERMRRMMRQRTISYKVNVPAKPYCAFRVRLSSDAVESWTFSELNFLKAGKEFSILGQRNFTSAWMSAGNADEWVYVDLGEKLSFDKVKLYWINKAASGAIEVSDDARSWSKVADLPAGADKVDEIAVSGTGRYVRLALDKTADGGRFALGEFEVYGKGGTKPAAQPQKAPEGNRMYLSGGNWKIQRVPEVAGTAAQIAVNGYDDSSWIPATVPATAVSSWYNIGAIPNINYDDDQLQISDSYFYSDFWYRDEFTLPADFAGKELVLNFDGINWKADVYFNGENVGRIEGAFIRGHFDVTKLAKAGTNTVAVYIYKNDNPGIIKEQTRDFTDTNGGVLGADNPTMHCSIGWDWIPTVRGRNIGIWNDVYLSAYDGGVSVDDVYVKTDLPLPSTDYADLYATVSVTNHSDAPKNAEISVNYGDKEMKGSVALAAGESKDVDLPVARLDKPQLWWPAGYGDQFLYDVKTTATVGGKVSDCKEQKMGVREMANDWSNGIIDIYVNGRRLIGNGGNWGFPEINLNYRGREYDIAVAYHADMHYTMIRDWVGQTGDEEFYEACDRHGVMIWQDFWLANPVDGPNPNDEAMFLANAEDYIKKVRGHAAIGLYCGRNEGNPPANIDAGLRALIEKYHPEIAYIPHSASGPVSGNGPYRALPVEEYFSAQRGIDRLHSERGMPNVMTYESMVRMLRPENYWPQTSVWGVHDYTLQNAQSAATFNALIEKAFGGEPASLQEFTERGQWINYNGYRAMYESRGWNRKGLLIWMSHSSWPSMVWQTYDYYFEPTAAYFGVKKASAPIRIQWNPVSKNVEVVNNNALDQNGLTAYAAILTYDGKVVFETSAALDSKEDTTTPVFPLTFDQPGLTDTYYIKLKLTRGDDLLADNFYWEGKEDGNYTQLMILGQAKVSVKAKYAKTADGYKVTATLRNTSKIPALMVRLKMQGSKSGESILPVFYEDNYFALLGGESKTVEITFKDEDCHGEAPELVVKGFNVKEMTK